MIIELGKASVATKGQGSGTQTDPFIGGQKVKLMNVLRNI
jgi:hypothetical protein